MNQHPLYQYLEDGITFQSRAAARMRTIYAPLCGPDATGIKSAITPCLAGDIKIDKFRYLTKPASTEDLRNGSRFVYLAIDDGQVVSTFDDGADIEAKVEVGQLWHRLTKTFSTPGVQIETLNFVPVNGDTVEWMRVTVRNASSSPRTLTPTVAVPIFARALENKHDHEHVTSLLNRIAQQPDGVLVSPPMSFDEKGHRPNHNVYFVYGADEQGNPPAGTFPTVGTFLGDAGTFGRPQAVYDSVTSSRLEDRDLQGKEAVGALQFFPCTLGPGEEATYMICMGVADRETAAQEMFQRLKAPSVFAKALDDASAYWQQKSHAITFDVGDRDANSWLQWVTLQPVLRRIFGCSFLPDHDYGKGGKGWRDIWQDLLSLILIEPDEVRPVLKNNFAGVRIDGSNATIIGSQPGEFIADRNAITRVWMDHGVWPFLTILLYIDQTGDVELLFEEMEYFRDPQMSRTFLKDTTWRKEDGHALKTSGGEAYRGSILEHLLVQNLVPFFNVGEHNLIRLESADWNDGLDMAFERGESVAFMSMYGGNLNSLADLIDDVAARRKLTTIPLARELEALLDRASGQEISYDDAAVKRRRLYDEYCPSVQPVLSGEKKDFAVKALVEDLRAKAQWIFRKIKSDEKIAVQDNGRTLQWFNGYYDNQGKRVEGEKDGRIRMTLTGQVFPIMSGLADAQEVEGVIESVEALLRHPELGGYHLNTDFGRAHYLDLGRAFGFAYGTKENGAFFSHMTVMYAYALYKRGFAIQGDRVLQSIFKMAVDTDKSKIYPGVPEYFDLSGKGMYHYLTGSASWLVLTMLTQVFGVRGQRGDLVLCPQLLKHQFSDDGNASVQCRFAHRSVRVRYHNASLKEFGFYRIQKVLVNDADVPHEVSSRVIIPRHVLDAVAGDVVVDVQLD